jgi:hypothetical protein
MIWIVLILVLGLLIAGLVFIWRRYRNIQPGEANPLGKQFIGMGVGGVAGAIIGILLVEYGGYSYPLPAVSWMIGMAAGQVGGILYSRYRR